MSTQSKLESNEVTTSPGGRTAAPCSVFVEFSLYLRDGQKPRVYEDVICFSSRPYTANAIEIIGDSMPKTWLDGYRWQDLNIMQEAYINKQWEPDLKRLKEFIMSFHDGQGPTPETLFMHIWHSRLPNDSAHPQKG